MKEDDTLSHVQDGAENHPTQAFTLTMRPDNIAVITIDVPGEKVNTLKAEFAAQMRAILAQIQSHQGVQGAIILSGKPASFIAGADISMLAACEDARAAEQLARTGQQVLAALAAMPFAVVAAIHGNCLGGGLELALACDYRVCSEDDVTRLGLPEVQLGLLPGAGGTQRLARLIGVDRALELILSGRQLRPAQARRLGVVDEVVPADVLIAAAVRRVNLGKRPIQPPVWRQRLLMLPYLRPLFFRRVERIAQAKAQGHYPAIERILTAVRTGLEHGEAAGYQAEATAFGQLVMSPESRALRRLFFINNRLKKAHDDAISPEPLRLIGIVGGGLMGSGIAIVTAFKAQLPVRIKDIHLHGITQVLRDGWQHLQRQVARRQITPAHQRRQMSLLSGSTDYRGFEQADIVIEAVPEVLALKQQMVRDIEAITSPNTVFATNTSSLPIHQIAAASTRPAQVVGLHYFSPVAKMPLVEVIVAAHTREQTVASVLSLAKKQGKTAIVVADSAGFYVNRILAPYLNEAAYCLLEGEPVESIDRVLVRFGFPLGPFALLDEVGIDVAMNIVPVLVAELGARFSAPPVLAAMARDNRHGRKNKRGFYGYTPSRYARLRPAWRHRPRKADPQIYPLLGITPTEHLDPALIVQRCVMMMLNEAVHCLDEQVIRHPGDGDIGAVMGIGFPPFLGGPFHYINQLGTKTVVATLRALQARYGERFTPAQGLLSRAEQGAVFDDDTRKTAR
ncbi:MULTISPECIES: fatty acid oxidation complex subunit alpha FadJ [Dickeya]|uniref:enoyl-CoA hydratase n=1 Tax=Dickeya aquatica TaxID=1401087 RepID=A0A375A9I5_9GAMM|nr:MULTISPECIES: fatty acid oxidation complex subunit alpha FadJ [Dickeya]SLM62299.1 Enoyl-CoA hydratase / Delta(3)-cis-delta(2)-trans-enoyl-CoA isomerase / 3-hydroxyacyl-CoA dehydrogenase / 3-hydroxybutyryl-CoA epimerase [Dickeya aquatica]